MWDTAVIIALITGVVQVCKEVGLPNKWSPLIAMIFGILSGTLYFYPDNWSDGIIYGLIIGLSSVGFYSGPRSIAQGIKTMCSKSKTSCTK